jgi:hypothetical protein
VSSECSFDLTSHRPSFPAHVYEFWKAPSDAPPGATEAPDGLTRDWIENQSQLPWLDLGLDTPAQAIGREASRLLHRFVEHRGEDHRGWKSLCLHGVSPTQTRSARHYGYSAEDEAPHRWTEVADQCPITTSFLKQAFPFRRLFRIRFMLLEPGGYISPHTDTETRGLAAINIAIINPLGAYLKLQGYGCVPFSDGRGFLLDIGVPHSCVNLSNEPRIHIIVHAQSPTPTWDELVVSAYRRQLGTRARSRP